MSLIHLLDAAKKITGSDNATAAAIGCGRAFISNIRAGRTTMPAHHAAKLAELTGQDWQVGALAALKEQSRTEPERAYWSSIIKQSGKGLTIALVAGIAMFSDPKTTYASGHIKSSQTIHYGKYNRWLSGVADQASRRLRSLKLRFVYLLRAALRGGVSRSALPATPLPAARLAS